MSTVEQVDAVVIGSGFGGAITAYHLAAAGARVVVLERGPDITSADLSTELPQLRWLQIVDAVIGDGVTVLAGNCVGGGSVHYFAASLRAPGFAFERAGTTGVPLWPRSITRQVLDPWYERAEQALPVAQLGWSDVSVQGGVMGAACAKAGRTCNPIALAVNLKKCTDCGWMFSGCAYDAKRSMMLNYLPAAQALGAEVRPLCEVQLIGPAQASGCRYRLQYSTLSPFGYFETGEDAIEAKVVVVAAGAAATPVLLRRSADQLGGIPDAVGKYFSGNGDHFFAFHMNQEQIASTLGLNFPGSGNPFDSFSIGKSITTIATDRLNGDLPEFHRGSFEDCYLPIFSNLVTALPIPGIGTISLTDQATHRPTPVSSLMTTLGMVEDENEGEFGAPPAKGAFNRLIPGIGFSNLSYRPDANSQAALGRSLAEQRAVFERDGIGSYVPDFNRLSLTAHPLATCRIGDDPAVSALDDQHELRGHPGLFVTDGSSVPGALCVNPSLTIAALAERASPFIVARLADSGVRVKYQGSLPAEKVPAASAHGR